MSDYLKELDAAQEYYDLGVKLNDDRIKREAKFRMYDTLQLATELTQACWFTYWRVGVQYEKATDTLDLSRVFTNMSTEAFPLASNLGVFHADIFFKDWLSFSYYTGDVVYRTAFK